ncbi:MAG: hypothetical protein RBS39_00395 [Phycisphaerales bacterium]|jgi:hypothetical protein|nr:hypothetical protein [Phycisphaerales bacterium]
MDGTKRTESARPALRLVNAERGVDASPLRPRNITPARGSGTLIAHLERLGEPARSDVRTTPPHRGGGDAPRRASSIEPSPSSPTDRASRPSPLRLARDEPRTAPTPAEREVARENKSAALMHATDARWALAVRTASSLDGGRAAILPPERRERLMKLSSTLGLRAFDAALVIAIVQDGARSGEGVLSASVVERVAMVRDPQEDVALSRERFAARRLLIALFCAGIAGGLLAMTLARWVMGG